MTKRDEAGVIGLLLGQLDAVQHHPASGGLWRGGIGRRDDDQMERTNGGKRGTSGSGKRDLHHVGVVEGMLGDDG